MDRSSDLARMVIVAVLAVFVALGYAGFAPPQQGLATLLAQAADPALTGTDPFLAVPGGFGPSLLYPLARLTGLGAPVELMSFPLHLALAAALLLWAARVIRRRLTQGDSTAAALTVLIGCFFTVKLLAGISLAPLPPHALTPRGLAQMIGLAALLAGLDRRPALAALGASLGLTIAPESGVPLALVTGAALGLDRSLGRRARLWAGLPLLAAAALLPALSEAAGPLLPAPSHQPPLALAVTLAASAWAILAGRTSQEPTLRAWLWSLGGGMGLATILACAVPALGVALPTPLDRLDLLGLVAPAGWLILTVGVAGATVSATTIGGLERLLRLGAVMVLAPTPLAATAAVGLALLARFLRLLREKLGWVPGAGLVPAAILPAVLMVTILTRSDSLLFGPGWVDPVAFNETGRWSEGVFADAATWHAWRTMAPLPDFPLVALYENRAFHDPARARVAASGELVTHPAANIAARKSAFLPPPGVIPSDPALRDEAAQREAAIVDLVHTLERGETLSPLPIGQVSPGSGRPMVEIHLSLEAFLTQRHMGVLVPPGLARLFPPTLPRRQVGDQILIGFGIFP